MFVRAHVIKPSLTNYRLRMKYPATIATVLDLHHRSVEVAIHLQMAIMAVDHLLPVVTALVVMIIVVAHHLPVMTTTLVTVAIVLLHHLARLVLLSTTLIPLLVEVTVVKTLTEHLHLVAATKILTLLTDTIDQE